jgi:flagellar motor component MotA
MEKDKFIQKKGILFIVGIIMIVLAIVATFNPVLIPIRQFMGNDSEIECFFGINSVLIVLGTMFFAFYLIRQWIIGIDYLNGQIEKQIEKEEKQKQQDQLIKDAEMRREFERQRNQINDLFRLIELAKEQSDEITDKSHENEEGTGEKQIDKDVFTKKNELLNVERLAYLIHQYQNFISK